MNINSSTKLICLLGHPIKQSFSPSIHNYLSEKYNKNNVYLCFDVEKANLKSTVEAVRILNMKGCNVTIPHKVDIIDYLDEVDKNSQLIGAVNTVKNESNKLIGFNTDGQGFVKSLIDKGYELQNKKVIILGAGGSCRSIAVELSSHGVASIEIRNRSDKNAEDIVTLINDNFEVECKFSIDSIKEEDLQDIDILINTTPVGMESNECPIDKNIVPSKDIIVCDIVYKPHNTELLSWAKSHKLKIVHGIDMLINQGILAYEIWENIKLNEDDFHEIKNIYFNSLK